MADNGKRQKFPDDKPAARDAATAAKVKKAAAKTKARRKGKSVKALQERHRAGEDLTGVRAQVQVGLTNSAILSGAEDLTTWSEEELVRGQKKAKNGRWTGRPPTVVPKAIHDELVKRTLKEAGEKLRSNLVEAITSLTEIAKDPDAPETARIQAASIIMDRVMGKAVDRVEITAEMPWMEALTEGIVATEEDFLDALDTTATEHPPQPDDPYVIESTSTEGVA